MTVSAMTARKLHRTDDNGGVLALLKIDHPDLSAPVRIVNDTRDLVTLGDTYIALPFEVKLPNDVSKEMPRAQLRMDNVGRELTAELERLSPGSSLQATLILVHRSTPGVVDYEFTSALSGVRTDMGTVTAVMGPDDLMRRPAVAKRYDPLTAPGLFPD